MIFVRVIDKRSTEVHERLEAWVRQEWLILQEIQLDRVHKDLEEERGVDFVNILGIFIRDLTG